jgi:hypothetical protein
VAVSYQVPGQTTIVHCALHLLYECDMGIDFAEKRCQVLCDTVPSMWGARRYISDHATIRPLAR